MSIAIEAVADSTSPAAGAAVLPPARALSLGHWRSRATLVVALIAVIAAGVYGMTAMVAPAPGAQLLTHTISRGDLVVSITEQGTLESCNNREIKCRVKGESTVVWVVETG